MIPYCSKCKWLSIEESDYGYDCKCMSPQNSIKTYDIRGWYSDGIHKKRECPYVINKDNTCKWWESRRWWHCLARGWQCVVG